MRRWLERVWYGGARGGAVLRPLAVLYGLIVRLRAGGYRAGLLPRRRVGRPVAVIGNLTVGGSGKTPLVAWAVGTLAARGLKVGIVSRGYGGNGRVQRVSAASDAREVGDEPLLLARRTHVPVAVGADRVAAARLIAAEVDLILADDGLQHYRLWRDLEIVVVDGRRRYGNGRLLPAGPLREPRARLGRADLIVVNGGAAAPGELAMQVEPVALVAFASGARLPLATLAGQRVHALAGIGDPQRFFASLRAVGLVPLEHPRADHAPLAAGELEFGDGLPVVMTEKDAVKCRDCAGPGRYWLEVEAQLSEADAARLLGRLTQLVER